MPLFERIGELCFLVLYVVPNALCLIALYKYLPGSLKYSFKLKLFVLLAETRQREIHEIVRDLIGNEAKSDIESKSFK